MTGCHKENAMKNAMYARTKSFFKEFPFLKKYIEVNLLGEKPRVERVDLELLDSYPYTAKWYMKYESSVSVGSERFFLFDSEGRNLGKVEQKDFKKFYFFKTGNISGETVYQALQRLENPEKVKYIVGIKDFLDPDKWKDTIIKTYMIVYKTPAGIPFSQWLSQIKG